MVGGKIPDRVKPKYWEKICASITSSTVNPTWTIVGLNPGLCFQNPVTTCLRGSTAKLTVYKYMFPNMRDRRSDSWAASVRSTAILVS
jgi:hypothetical protein